MLACANIEWESKRDFSVVLDYLSEIMESAEAVLPARLIGQASTMMQVAVSYSL